MQLHFDLPAVANKMLSQEPTSSLEKSSFTVLYSIQGTCRWFLRLNARPLYSKNASLFSLQTERQQSFYALPRLVQSKAAGLRSTRDITFPSVSLVQRTMQSALLKSFLTELIVSKMPPSFSEMHDQSSYSMICSWKIYIICCFMTADNVPQTSQSTSIINKSGWRQGLTTCLEQRQRDIEGKTKPKKKRPGP